MRGAICVMAAAIAAAQGNPAATAARDWRKAHQQALLAEFTNLLSIPNLADDPSSLRRNAAAVEAILARRGVRTRLLESPGAPPAVFGEMQTPGAARTVVMYAHYDGQALDPKEWRSPPFQPIEREGRIWARSSSDDKAPVIAMAAALDALGAAKIPLHTNWKFFIEGEEEQGSPHLAEMLAKDKGLLAGDLWLICDGPVHPSRRQQILFGARGIVTMDITVYGPNHELHSGHYGGWAPNPARMLARLLASMQDDDGRVLIEHFHEGVEPLGALEQRALRDAPDTDADLRREFWLGATEGRGAKLLDLINRPSLTIHGLAAARVGERAANVVPATATASLDLRLVKGMDHTLAARRVIDHIRKQGYFIVEAEPDRETRMAHPKIARVTVGAGGYNAARAPMDLAIAQSVVRAAESARGAVIRLPTVGGSVPLYIFNEVLQAPAIMLPIANHDNNQHAANENLLLENLWDGIELMAAVFAMPAL